MCVLDSGGNFVRDEFGDLQSEAFERLLLGGVVGHEPQLVHAEFLQNQCHLRVVAHVAVQAERQVRVEGVESCILQRVGAELVDQADAASFVVAHVDEVPSGAADDAQTVLQLGAAIASEGTENVAGGAFGVDAHRGHSPVLGGYGGAVTVEGAGADVLGAVCESPGAQTEQALRGGYGDLFGAFDQ